MPRALTPDQRVLLQTVWDLVGELGRWPTFVEVDRRLYRGHELETVALAAGLEPGLLLPQDLRYSRDDHELQLSLAAIANCDGSGDAVELFFEAIAIAVHCEAETDLGDPEAMLHASDLLGHSRVGTGSGRNTADLVRRVGLMLGAEHWGWSSYSIGTPDGPPTWSFTLTRRIRQLRDVTDLETYWQSIHPATESVTQVGTAQTSSIHEARHRWRRAVNHPWAITLVGGVVVGIVVAILSHSLRLG